uniref:Disease resistance N-terminal domain-containing protein n=1 Tax=Nelumbo nucifera TaxID=4432 RepID=A0A822XXC3_NELNU|nr:TPA_asm: hypothetical protein HUJ06_026441 [Nelumbo nucifera]
MADKALSFISILAENLAPMLVERLSGGVDAEVKFLKDELESMKALLKEADTKGDCVEGVKAWMKQVRELAYDVEDIPSDRVQT